MELISTIFWYFMGFVAGYCFTDEKAKQQWKEWRENK